MAELANSEKVKVIACGAIAREIVDICQQRGLDHIDLTCLPAIWHIRPEKIAPGLKEKISQARNDGFVQIFIGYAECGTKGEIDKICAEEQISRLPGPHCYAFYTGVEKFMDTGDDDITSFYLTDLIARQFEAFIIEPMKFDKHPELIPMMFGNYKKLVYLAQTNDDELQAKAQWAANYLGLEYEYRFTGYGDLEPELVATNG